MKKILLILLFVVLAVGIAAGITVYINYASTGEDSIPAVSASAFGQPLTLTETEWHTPVLGGLLYKDFHRIAALDMMQAEFTSPIALDLATPPGYEARLSLTKEGTVVFEGTPAEWDDSYLLEEGDYGLSVTCTKPQQDGESYGRFVFGIPFIIHAPPPEPEKEPTFLAGADTLQQGDVFTMMALHLPAGVVPTAETDLGLAVFTPMEEENCWFAAVPVGIKNDVLGEHVISVAAGELSWQATLTVTEFPFIRQNLVIDETAPEITEANSPEAYAQYNAKVPPLWQTFDDERYWEGEFIWPVSGRISTEFGLTRITNGDESRARTHPALDIAVAEGTPIVAPNHGRVVFAEYLLNTGWTIAIEHGGGLKSFYYHCSEINVAVDDRVEKGQQIGLVGTTGYSTGPHLHFEMRIGTIPISPTMLLENPSAGLYVLWAHDEVLDLAA